MMAPGADLGLLRSLSAGAVAEETSLLLDFPELPSKASKPPQALRSLSALGAEPAAAAVAASTGAWGKTSPVKPPKPQQDSSEGVNDNGAAPIVIHAVDIPMHSPISPSKPEATFKGAWGSRVSADTAAQPATDTVRAMSVRRPRQSPTAFRNGNRCHALPTAAHTRKRADTVPLLDQNQRLPPGVGEETKRLTNQLKLCADMGELLGILAKVGNQPSFNHIHASAALVCAANHAKRGICNAAQFSQCIQVARRFTAWMDHRGVSNGLWSQASSGHPIDKGFADDLLKRCLEVLDTFTGHSVANAAWGMAQLRVNDAAVTEALMARAAADIGSFDARSLGGSMFAFAKLRQSSQTVPEALPALLAVAIPAIYAVLAEYGANDLANTLWAMAILGHYDIPFIDALMVHIRRKLPEFQSHQHATMLYALGRMRQDADVSPTDLATILPEMLHAGATRIPTADAQDLANSAWALATLHHHDPNYMLALMQRAEFRMPSFNHQGLSNLAWAIATLAPAPASSYHSASSYPYHQTAAEQNAAAQLPAMQNRQLPASFLKALLTRAKALIRTMMQQNLCNLAWAMGKLGHYDQELMGMMMDRAETLMGELNSQDLANLLYSQSRLRHMDRQFLVVAVRRCHRLLPTFLPQQLASVLSALAKLGQYDGVFVAQAVACARKAFQSFMHQVGIRRSGAGGGASTIGGDEGGGTGSGGSGRRPTTAHPWLLIGSHIATLPYQPVVQNWRGIPH